MHPLDLESEKYGAHGNAASQGILKQLGQPKLDLFSLLIREAVQNSWDARLADTATVHFGVIGHTLSDQERQFLRDTVLANEPDTLNYIHTSLSVENNHHALLIYDRGTTGLDGPTRADIPANGEDNRNFVNFFRNVGQSKSKHLVGGTYGYGKSVLYRVSQLNTICVHTRCLVNGQSESRFIAAALEPQALQTQTSYNPYTGRHWWGRKQDNVIEPVIGPDADEIALKLGFPSFQNKELGTTCMILLPTCGDRQLEDVLQQMVKILLWYFWPKMLNNTHGIPPMSFTIQHNTQSLPIPDPITFPPLQGFVQAMQELKNNNTGEKEDFMQKLVNIHSQRPKKLLGQLSLRRFPREERLDNDTDQYDSFPPVPDVCHHVALMRGTELVVKYLAGPPMASSRIEYAGVFVVDEGVDEAFAKAEPPTHDDWNAQSLTERSEKTFVNVALTQLKQHLDSFATPQQTAGKGGSLTALGDFADQLGSLLIGVDGIEDNQQTSQHIVNKPEPPDDLSKNDSANAKKDGTLTLTESLPQPLSQKIASVILAGDARLVLVDEIPALLLNFSINHAIPSKSTRVEITSNIVLDNNELEREPPSRGEKPEVLQWIDADGKIRSGSDAIVIPASDTRQWQVTVSMPTNTFLNVNLIAQKIV